jgi:hypothetical protein
MLQGKRMCVLTGRILKKAQSISRVHCFGTSEIRRDRFPRKGIKVRFNDRQFRMRASSIREVIATMHEFMPLPKAIAVCRGTGSPNFKDAIDQCDILKIESFTEQTGAHQATHENQVERERWRVYDENPKSILEIPRHPPTLNGSQDRAQNPSKNDGNFIFCSND